jgi:tRNA-splicing ligase RtcB
MYLTEQITVFGQHEENTLKQIERCIEDDRVAAAVLCADGHFGYNVPIGGVVAYRNAISPSGVGFDIACGNKAVRLDMPGSELRESIVPIMNDIWRKLSFGVGRKNAEKIEHPLFEDNPSLRT